MERTTKTIKTKLSKTAPEQNTVLTIEWDSADDARKFAERAIIIAAQSRMRASESIPAALTVKVSDLAKRQAGFGPATPESTAARINAMDADKYRAALVALGLDGKTIERMMKARNTK